MISSLILRFEPNWGDPEKLVSIIGSRPEIETGDLIDHCRLPITVDATDPAHMESITDALRMIPGVAFVDIVYVQLEHV